MGDLFFDRVLALGSGVLGVLLLAGAAMHLREPVSGVARETATQVADASEPPNTARVAALRTAAESTAAMRAAASTVAKPIAAAQPRVHIVAWPSDAPDAAPVRRFVERRSTRIVPSSIRTERKPQAPPTRVATRGAQPPAELAPRTSEHVRNRHSDRPLPRAAGRPVTAADRQAAGGSPAAPSAALRRAVRAGALAIGRAMLAKKPVLTAATKTGRRPKLVVALRAAIKLKPRRVRKRRSVPPLPQPPVGYDPSTNVVQSTIEATTASSIAADPSDANRPSVIVLERGR